MVGCNEHAALGERGCNLAGGTFLVACQHWDLRAFNLSSEYRYPQHQVAAFLEALGAHFYFNVDLDATMEFCGIQQAFHERYLIDRTLEKELAKRKKAGLGELSAPVTISVAGMIRCSEAGLVLRFFACEPTRNRPEACPDSESLEESVGHQACDAAVAIQKRMDPQETMVNRPDRLNLAQSA